MRPVSHRLKKVVEDEEARKAKLLDALLDARSVCAERYNARQSSIISSSKLENLEEVEQPTEIVSSFIRPGSFENGSIVRSKIDRTNLEIALARSRREGGRTTKARDTGDHFLATTTVSPFSSRGSSDNGFVISSFRDEDREDHKDPDDREDSEDREDHKDPDDREDSEDREDREDREDSEDREDPEDREDREDREDSEDRKNLEIALARSRSEVVRTTWNSDRYIRNNLLATCIVPSFGRPGSSGSDYSPRDDQMKEVKIASLISRMEEARKQFNAAEDASHYHAFCHQQACEKMNDAKATLSQATEGLQKLL